MRASGKSAKSAIAFALTAAVMLVVATEARADEIRVITSGAFTAAYKQLIAEFERQTSHKLISAYGASLGGAPDSIPVRLERREPADVVILSRVSLDRLIADGKVVAGSGVDLIRSTIGMSVRAGAPKPDISTVEALKRTLLAAKSVSFSASNSGTYLSTELFPKLGIAEEMKPKSHRIMSERAGASVARGEVELAFEQISELLPVPGIDFVGPLPTEVQRVTIYSAGVVSYSKVPAAARELIEFLSSPAAFDAIRKSALEPANAK